MIRLLTIAALALGTALPAPAAEPRPGERLAQDQTYAFWLPDAVKTLDPQKNADPQGAEVIRQLFEGLMNADASGAPVPGVAASYDLSDDRLTYTFHLRPAAKWSNGEPVTAGDFVYAWRRLADPETASEQAWLLELMHVENATEVIKGAKKPAELGVAALDAQRFQIRLTAPAPYLPRLLSHPATYPVNRKVVEKGGEGWTRPGTLVGNGAYLLDSHDLGVQVGMVPNPRYWDAAHVVIRSLRAVTVRDDKAALARYLDGKLDRLRIPAGQYPRLAQDRPAEAVAMPQGCTYGFVMNLGDKGSRALRDPRVRQALSLAMPRDAVVGQILQGGQQPAWGWTHPATQGFAAPPSEAAGWTPAQRLDRARALLAEAGHGPDRPLTLGLTFNTDDTHRRIAEAARQALAPLGVRLALHEVAWKVQVERMQTGEFDLARQTWCADYNEASTFLNVFRTDGANPGHYSDAEFDRLLDHARNAADPNPDYVAAEAILQRDMPLIPVYHYARAELVRGDIRGLPTGNMMNEWWAKDLYRVAR